MVLGSSAVLVPHRDSQALLADDDCSMSATERTNRLAVAGVVGCHVDSVAERDKVVNPESLSSLEH